MYNLAADMGGIGFIETHKAECMLSVLISTHMLLAAQEQGVEQFFYSSSACVYAADKQDRPDIPFLVEADAYPAMPEDGYGWEKLFAERMARHFREDYGIATRVVRYHNVYGPNGSWRGGREKAPAAICRKVAMAKRTGDRHRARALGWPRPTATARKSRLTGACERIAEIGALPHQGERAPQNANSCWSTLDAAAPMRPMMPKKSKISG